MEKQQTLTVFPDKKEPKLNLLALVFFMMGALPLYVQFQGGNNEGHIESGRDKNRLFKITLLAVLVGATLEMFVF
ncbi:hypothetical protein PCC7424_4428 [Gloeothece citriformis PCC 7424]|uniref:Uncharacterized protein n=1 Tax=Gloeothece citriformis (strain PCC 7424) TaxID=65393 RepID=B7K923_GLOC7|nr:hypothetical protein [Gloeothece citriformis]ACK72792.1 hypothetical protein PCC7424_4428 [Gloeothece citriformis PCC 7424]